VRDIFGNSIADSVFQKHVVTVNPDTFTAIMGSIQDRDTTAQGPFVLRAVSVKNRDRVWLYEITEDDNDYAFRDIMPGQYIIDVYRDEDENGRFSRGEPFPFQPAERFTVYPDTIEVRARWPNEGNNIQFP
jgi:uncharacterized protein (DUF2141 family)